MPQQVSAGGFRERVPNHCQLRIKLATFDSKIQVSYDVQDESKRVFTCGCAWKWGSRTKAGSRDRERLPFVRRLLTMHRHDVGSWVSYSVLTCGVYITLPALAFAQHLTNNQHSTTNSSTNSYQTQSTHIFQPNFYIISKHVRNDGESQGQGRPGDAQGQDPW
jgi:hypothetical protein